MKGSSLSSSFKNSNPGRSLVFSAHSTSIALTPQHTEYRNLLKKRFIVPVSTLLVPFFMLAKQKGVSEKRIGPWWWRNRTGRPLSPLQIHRKNNWTLSKFHKNSNPGAMPMYSTKLLWQWSSIASPASFSPQLPTAVHGWETDKHVALEPAWITTPPGLLTWTCELGQIPLTL